MLRCDDCIAYHIDQCVKVGIKDEELWEAFGHKKSVHLEKWPVYKEYTRVQTEVAVQVNGRLRAVIAVATDAEEEAVAVPRRGRSMPKARKS